MLQKKEEKGKRRSREEKKIAEPDIYFNTQWLNIQTKLKINSKIPNINTIKYINQDYIFY